MSRQYFMDLLADSPLADLPAWATITTDTLLWNPALWTPIAAGDAKAGKIYKVTAGGIITLPASTGSLTLTPRAGAVIGSPSMGSSGAIASPGATTNRPWWLEFIMCVRAIAVAGGGASTVNGWGKFETAGLTGAAPFVLTFGGTQITSFDATAASGIGISAIWGTTAGSITPQFACIQSLN
jgi:hypothetical protein